MELHALLRRHGLSHESATVILSSGMAILHASPKAQDVLRELKGSIKRADVTVPPSIIAYIGQGIMKQIQIQRVVGDFSPISGQYSINSVRTSYHCCSLGIPSKLAIEESMIILALHEDRWASIRLRPTRLWFHFSKLQSQMGREPS